MTDFTYAAVVMDRGAPREDWRAYVRDALADDGIRLVARKADVESELRGDDGHLLGFARFDELSSAGDRPAFAPWIAAGEYACPWMGRPAGLFRWTHPAADVAEKNRLIRAVARGARGAVAHRDTPELRELISQRTYSLTHLTSSYGFSEGTELLELTPGAYMQDAIDRVEAILASAGLEAAAVGHVPDEHKPDGNPLRVFPPLVRNGEGVPIADTDHTLHMLDELPLWVVDRDATNPNDWFWLD